MKEVGKKCKSFTTIAAKYGRSLKNDTMVQNLDGSIDLSLPGQYRAFKKPALIS